MSSPSAEANSEQLSNSLQIWRQHKCPRLHGQDSEACRSAPSVELSAPHRPSQALSRPAAAPGLRGCSCCLGTDRPACRVERGRLVRTTNFFTAAEVTIKFLCKNIDFFETRHCCFSLAVRDGYGSLRGCVIYSVRANANMRKVTAALTIHFFWLCWTTRAEQRAASPRTLGDIGAPCRTPPALSSCSGYVKH